MFVDGPPVKEKDAAFLLWYHLRQAAALFEILPGDIKIHQVNFITKQFFSDELSDPLYESEAGIAFLDRLKTWHESMED